MNCPPSDTLTNDGKGAPVGYTGMTWSGFRPSDDACKYGYLIPSNMFASVVLDYMAEFLEKDFQDPQMAKEAKEFGFIDEVVETDDKNIDLLPLQTSLNKFQNVPAALLLTNNDDDMANPILEKIKK